MSKVVERPQLGEWRMITCVAVRRTSHKRNERTNRLMRLKTWEKWARWRKASPAMFVGYRTVADGETDWIDEAGYVFVAHKHQELWLFVSDARQTPFYVFPEDVLPLESPEAAK